MDSFALTTRIGIAQYRPQQFVLPVERLKIYQAHSLQGEGCVVLPQKHGIGGELAALVAKMNAQAA
jgi:hypothetical protein